MHADAGHARLALDASSNAPRLMRAVPDALCHLLGLNALTTGNATRHEREHARATHRSADAIRGQGRTPWTVSSHRVSSASMARRWTT